MPNVNKVIYGNNTLIDISDTTATESDVASGVVFYKADGTRSVGTASSGGFPEFTITGSITPTVTGGGIDAYDIKYALTADRTIGMIYGYAVVRGAGSNTSVTMTLGGLTVAQPTQTISIRGLFIPVINQNATTAAQNLTNIHTDGSVDITYAFQTNATKVDFLPIVVRFSDFA